MRLSRLSPAVRRAVAGVAERREHLGAEQSVRERDHLLRSVLNRAASRKQIRFSRYKPGIFATASASVFIS